MSKDRRDDILRKVQALLARAMGTPFEAEADTARAKASYLMDQYRIEQWELAQAEAGRAQSSLKPVREDLDISWYYNENRSFSSALYSMFVACLDHCAVVYTNRFSRPDYTMPAYGLASDIAFAQMLFTDLYVQMSSKIKPEFDPSKDLGENVYRAKEAGMKYKDIATWIGEPELVNWGVDQYGRPKVKSISKKLITAYRKYANANGYDTHQEISLDAYVEDFCSSYSWAVVQKLRSMRGEQVQGDSMSLAIRDITDLSKEKMYEDFPEMRPHPADCDCDRCHRCSDPKCQRPRCKAARIPVRTRGMGSYRLRQANVAAQARGAKAGSEARIMSRGPTVGSKKGREIGS
jgi:Protein of unknown function (DUF2786)